MRGRLDELQQTLETDIPAQEATLRDSSKLRDYQYDTEAFFLEMFQNADDAVVELSRRRLGCCTARPAQGNSEILGRDTGIVRFAH